MSSYNPFARLFENEPKLNPYARIIRSSFTDKMQDTYLVLNGHQHYLVKSWPENDHAWDIGVLDWLGFYLVHSVLYILYCLGMFFIAACMLCPSVAPAAILWGAGFLAAAFILDVAVTTMRFLISLVLLVIVSPFVAIVHAVSTVQCYFINKKIEEATVELTQIGLPDKMQQGDYHGIRAIDKGKYRLYFYTIKEKAQQKQKLVVVKDTSSIDLHAPKPDKTKCSYKVFSQTSERVTSKLVSALCQLNEQDFAHVQANCF